MSKKTYPTVKFKWWYCVVVGLATIIDGLTMTLTLGWLATSLALRYSIYGASKNIYRNNLNKSTCLKKS
mgnify:CR=1 FL=1